MYNGQTPSRNKSEYWNGNIKWLSSGELNRGTVYDSIETITEEGQKAANLRIVPKGTFIMAITGLEAAGTRGNCALLGFDTTLNQSCMALFPKQEMLTSEFLFQWYRKVGEEYGINYTQGTKQQSYNAELIKILPISLPSVAEQRKIFSYLSNLDHLITLHQRKCDELQKLKKFMLQNMFTNIDKGESHLFFECIPHYLYFIKKDKYPTGHSHEIRCKKRFFLRRMLQHIKRCCEKMSKINVSIQKKLL